MQNIVKCTGILISQIKLWGVLVTRKRNVKPRFWVMMMAILLVVFCGVYVSQAGYMGQQQAQIAQLEIQRDAVMAENAGLERKISFSKTNEFIERTAREELGLLKPGEIRFVAGANQAVGTDGQ